MGSSRYVGKIPEWKKKIDEVVNANNPIRLMALKKEL
jgi:hypothetical protein